MHGTQHPNWPAVERNRLFSLAMRLGFPVLAAVFTGATIGLYGDMGGGAIAALIAIVAAALRPREAVYVVLAFGLLQFLFTKSYPILPLWVSGLDDVLLIGILGRSILDMIACQRKLNAPVVLTACIVWITCGALTGLLHGQSMLTMALAFRGIVLPIAMLLAAGLYCNNSCDRERLRGIIIIEVTFHAALSIVQWAAAPSQVDVAFGVLGPGGANAGGFLNLMALLLLLSRPLTKRDFLVATILIVATITASARAAVYIMPLSLLVLFLSRGSVLKGVVRGLGALSVVGIALWSYSMIRGGGLEDFAFNQLIQAQYNPGQGGRLLYLMSLPRVLGNDMLSWLFGLGPGSFTSYVGIGVSAPAYLLVAPIRYGINNFKLGFAYPDIQWAALLGEYGLTGTIAVLVILFAPILRWWKRHGKIAARGDVTLALPALGVALFAAMVTLNVLEFQPLAYIYWTIAGLIYSLSSVNATKAVVGKIAL